MARSGSVSGTLTLNYGRGNPSQVVPRAWGYGQCRQWPAERRLQWHFRGESGATGPSIALAALSRSPDVKRRAFLGALAASALPPMAHSQSVAGTPEPTPSERGAMATLARAYMGKYDIPALSVAGGRAGRIVYQVALGLCARERR